MPWFTWRRAPLRGLVMPRNGRTRMAPRAWEPCLLHSTRPTHPAVSNRSSPHYAEALEGTVTSGYTRRGHGTQDGQGGGGDDRQVRANQRRHPALAPPEPSPGGAARAHGRSALGEQGPGSLDDPEGRGRGGRGAGCGRSPRVRRGNRP